MKRTNPPESSTPMRRTKLSANHPDVVNSSVAEEQTEKMTRAVVEVEYIGTPFNPTIGRPTDYREVYVHQARQLCLLCHALDESATIDMLANFFHCGDATIKRWMGAHDDFRAAIKGSRERAAGDVVMSLFKRALGFDHVEVRTTLNSAGKVMNRVETLKHTPPDTGAICFALKNWASDHWKERKQVSGDPDHPLIPQSSQLNVQMLDDATLNILMHAVVEADAGETVDGNGATQPTIN